MMIDLPNYFLADLSAEATLSASMISEACHALKRNRDQYLCSRATQCLVALLSDLAESWLDHDYPFRQLALQLGPETTGFSVATFTAGLDAFFRQLTADNLHALLQQELGHVQRLDQFVATAGDTAGHHGAQRGNDPGQRRPTRSFRRFPNSNPGKRRQNVHAATPVRRNAHVADPAGRFVEDVPGRVFENVLAPFRSNNRQCFPIRREVRLSDVLEQLARTTATRREQRQCADVRELIEILRMGQYRELALSRDGQQRVS